MSFLVVETWKLHALRGTRRPFFDDAVCLFACMVAQSRTVCGCLGWAVWVIVGGDGLRGVRCVIVLNEIFETERERIELRPGSSHHVK